MSEAPGRFLQVAGSHYEMGRQHGRHARPLRQAILAAMALRLEQLAAEGAGAAFDNLVAETVELLTAVDEATVAFVRGLADGLELPSQRLLYYNLAAFLRDALTTRPALREGCTTWAASGAATAGGETLLVKNRDYRREHLPLQMVVRARPERGHTYIYVTSAGSPGVFVAGMNEAGLAVADTHVSSADVGPGLPAYALAMHLLEEQGNVAGALDYLGGAPRLGRNNFVLADSQGEMAVFEIGHNAYGVRRPVDGTLVSTNHFNHPVMAPAYAESEPPALRGNSRRRYAAVVEALRRARGRVDLAWAQALMAHHDGPLASICRHLHAESETSTIAGIIFQPQQGLMHVCHGRPCQAAYQAYTVR